MLMNFYRLTVFIWESGLYFYYYIFIRSTWLFLWFLRGFNSIVTTSFWMIILSNLCDFYLFKGFFVVLNKRNFNCKKLIMRRCDSFFNLYFFEISSDFPCFNIIKHLELIYATWNKKILVQVCWLNILKKIRISDVIQWNVVSCTSKEVFLPTPRNNLNFWKRVQKNQKRFSQQKDLKNCRFFAEIVKNLLLFFPIPWERDIRKFLLSWNWYKKTHMSFKFSHDLFSREANL